MSDRSSSSSASPALPSLGMGAFLLAKPSGSGRALLPLPFLSAQSLCAQIPRLFSAAPQIEALIARACPKRPGAPHLSALDAWGQALPLSSELLLDHLPSLRSQAWPEGASARILRGASFDELAALFMDPRARSRWLSGLSNFCEFPEY